MYHAYVTTLKNVRKHPNADCLLLGECFDNTVCVSLDFYEGQTVGFCDDDCYECVLEWLQQEAKEKDAR